MMIQRTLWATAMLVLFLLPILVDPLRFLYPVVIVAFGTLTIYEIVLILRAKGLRVEFYVPLLAFLAFVVDAQQTGLANALYIIMILLMVLLVERVMRSDFDNIAAEVGAALVVALYVGMASAMSVVFMERPGPTGEWLGRFHVLFLISIVFSGDSAAYIVGSRYGRHKFFPAISPKKSVEGAVASVVVSILAALICLLVSDTLRRVYGFADGMTLGVLLALGAPIGDLAESLFKRDSGVKDSSHLIAGHGGFLDVFDALIFCLPIQYCYFYLLIA